MSSRRSRAGIALLASAVALSWGIAGCAPRSRPAGGASADVAPSAADAGDEVARPDDSLATAAAVDDESFQAALVPLRDVEIIARLDGEIVSVDIEEGRRVHRDARLAQIDDREQRATLSVREAEFARAEAAWRRVKRLHDQKVVSDEDRKSVV